MRTRKQVAKKLRVKILEDRKNGLTYQVDLKKKRSIVSYRCQFGERQRPEKILPGVPWNRSGKARGT